MDHPHLGSKDVPAFLAFLGGTLAFLLNIFLPRPRKNAYPDQPNCFRIWKAEPRKHYGCSAQLIIIGLFVVSIGFVIQNRDVILAVFVLIAICILNVLGLIIQDWRQGGAEHHSLSRVELTSDSIFVYDEIGNVIDSVKFEDIIDLPMYQGVDQTRKYYEHRVLKCRSGAEIMLPPHIQNKSQLRRMIQEATKLKFGYRNNSTRL